MITGVPKPVADLGGDAAVCSGDSLILTTADGPWEFMWNGQPGGNTLVIYGGGAYEVLAGNQCGQATDAIVVTEYATPQIDLGSDQLLQAGESIELDAGSGFDQYVWQDGSSGQVYVVKADEILEGVSVVWAEVWTGSCKSSDTVLVEVFRVKVPNVITPNGDGVNDDFTPMSSSWSGISSHHIEVFNRWGEKVWESDDFESGWDGKRNGNYVAEGTYFWILELNTGGNGQSFRYKGTVTVIGSNH